MVEICPVCGLPKDLCVCESIAKEDQYIEVKIDKKKYGKLITVITGFEKNINVKELSKQLKSKFACGGTTKEDVIELQGDYTAKIKEVLIDLGFPSSQILIDNKKPQRNRKQ